MTHKCDGLARFFDFIFVGGFGTLAVLYLILRISKDHSIADYCLVGYYIFFTLFMLGVVFRMDIIIKNFGFLDNVLLKSVFYVL